MTHNRRRGKGQSSAPKRLLTTIEGWNYLGRPFGVNKMYDAVKPGGAFSAAVIEVEGRKFLSVPILDRIIAQGVIPTPLDAAFNPDEEAAKRKRPHQAAK